MHLTRRKALHFGSAAIGSLTLPSWARQAAAAEAAGTTGPAPAGEIETYGLSTFGELELPPDFQHLRYVNPDAPKGGTLSIQLREEIGNQNFDTFDTLNIYVFKGNGAAGMDATFDTLMGGTGDEANAVYGLVAERVRVTADKLTYRFLLRPQARFNDGSPLTATDVAFSLNVLKSKGHPLFRVLLTEMAGAEAESDSIVKVTFTPNRSRDIHLVVAGLPIFSQAWWQGRDFEASTLDAPLGSGPYKVARFEQGRFIEFERVQDYWGAGLPLNIGSNNFDRIRYEYYREREVAFEAFKAGAINFNEEFTARIWATAYDFPAVQDGRVKKEELHDGAPISTQGWYFNTRRDQFKDPRIREAIGLAFDFEWTNRNIMYSAYKRLTSFFQNSPMMAVGPPGPDELALLEPFRGRIPDEVFGDPYVPPVSDGSGSDRTLLRRADELFKAAGCTRDGSVLKLPNGQPLQFELLDSSSALEAISEPFQANLRKLGVVTQFRIVDSAQYQSRLNDFDFDVVTMALGGSLTPGDDLRDVFSSAAAGRPGSRNLAGIADPAVDALLDRIAKVTTRQELDTACRALDRVLRAGRYWVPMWYRDTSPIAYWDVFSRPPSEPKYATGAPGIWWWDAEKAKRIGYQG
jgi:microcin C transport system substrate-binding protein